MRARTDPTGWLACMVAMRIPGDAERRQCIRCRAGSHADVRYADTYGEACHMLRHMVRAGKAAHAARCAECFQRPPSLDFQCHHLRCVAQSQARGSRHRQGGGTHHSMLRQKWQHRHLASHLVQRGVFCVGNQRSRGTRSFAKHQSQKHPVQSPQSTQVRRSISSSPPMAWDSG